mmetsp:Transcript_42455/g.68281  ORF Transcript_42455/g.68281 Transcript_42455/m.68281 type:complete len:358 (+) Transcript_42455:3660-4733(+)
MAVNTSTISSNIYELRTVHTRPNTACSPRPKIINFPSLVMQYPKNSLRRLYREVRSLETLNHPHIVHMEEYFSTKDNLYIVEERMYGGELYDKIIKNQGLREDHAKIIFFQLASALEYMHARNVIHRDIKPENVMFVDNDSCDVKLIDFGFSRTMNGGHASSFLGTGGFLAPELRLKSARNHDSMPIYSKSVDVWALGCLLYVMVAGRMPFEDTLYYRPKTSYVLHFRPARKWAHTSVELRDLISKMLAFEPLARFSMLQVLCHPWLRNERTLSESALSSIPSLSNMQNDGSTCSVCSEDVGVDMSDQHCTSSSNQPLILSIEEKSPGNSPNGVRARLEKFDLLEDPVLSPECSQPE